MHLAVDGSDQIAYVWGSRHQLGVFPPKILVQGVCIVKFIVTLGCPLNINPGRFCITQSISQFDCEMIR